MFERSNPPRWTRITVAGSVFYVVAAHPIHVIHDAAEAHSPRPIEFVQVADRTVPHEHTHRDHGSGSQRAVEAEAAMTTAFHTAQEVIPEGAVRLVGEIDGETIEFTV